MVEVITKHIAFSKVSIYPADTTNGNYSFTNIGSLANTPSTETWVALTPALAEDTSITISKDPQTIHDVVYYLSSVSYWNLQSGKSQTLPITLTCSLSGTTPIKHLMNSYFSDHVTQWLSFDEATSSFVANVPASFTNTSFLFRSKVSGVGDMRYIHLYAKLCSGSS